MLENGIGINTGVALVGNIGAEGKKMDYTMIGDQVNLAARFQGLTRTLGHPILLTEFTASKLALGPDRGKPYARRMGLDQIHLRKLQVVTVKGRQEPVGAYTVEVQYEGAGRKASVGYRIGRGLGDLAGRRTRLSDLVDSFFPKDVHEFRVYFPLLALALEIPERSVR